MHFASGVSRASPVVDIRNKTSRSSGEALWNFVVASPKSMHTGRAGSGDIRKGNIQNVWVQENSGISFSNKSGAALFL